MAPKKKKIPKPAPKPKDTSKKKKKNIPDGFAIKSKPKKTKIKISGRTVTPGVLNLRDKIKKLKQKKVQKTNQVQLNPPNNFQNWGQFIEKLPYGVADQIVGDVFQKAPTKLGDFLNLPNVKNPIIGEYQDYFQEFDDYSGAGPYTQEDNPPTLFQKQIDRFNYLNKRQQNEFKPFMKDRSYFNTNFPPNERKEFEKYTQYFAQNNTDSYENSLRVNKYGDTPERRGKFGKIKPPKPSKLTKRDRELKLLQEMKDSKF